MRRKRQAAEPVEAEAPEKDKTPWHPVFDVQSTERHPEQTDEQYEAGLRAKRHFAMVEGIYLGFFQMLCTHRGFPLDCRRGACRRLKKCSGRHAQDDWSFCFKPYVPPRVPPYEDIIEEMRRAIRAEMEWREARRLAEGGETARDDEADWS